MKMDYRRDLQHNYLVAEDGEDTENYITRMMTENQVQGLLGCECRRMDQKKLYYYDITSKISLAEKCRYKKIKGSEVLLVVQGLLQVLVQLEEYLIPADRICLDWNYIYLDPASGQPSFCCLPVTEKELEQGVRELLEELLPRLDHQEQDGVSVVYELYQYAVRESFSVMELQGVLERRMLEQRKSLRRESQMYGEKENSFPSENGYANTEEAGRSYLAGERKSIQEESVRSWEKEKRAGKSASGREEEQFRTDRRNHERALEDFFSVEEEENETDRLRRLGVFSGVSWHLGSDRSDCSVKFSDLAGDSEEKKKRGQSDCRTVCHVSGTSREITGFSQTGCRGMGRKRGRGRGRGSLLMGKPDSVGE